MLWYVHEEDFVVPKRECLNVWMQSNWTLPGPMGANHQENSWRVLFWTMWQAYATWYFPGKLLPGQGRVRVLVRSRLDLWRGMHGKKGAEVRMHLYHRSDRVHSVT